MYQLPSIIERQLTVYLRGEALPSFRSDEMAELLSAINAEIGAGLVPDLGPDAQQLRLAMLRHLLAAIKSSMQAERCIASMGGTRCH